MRRGTEVFLTISLHSYILSSSTTFSRCFFMNYCPCFFDSSCNFAVSSGVSLLLPLKRYPDSPLSLRPGCTFLASRCLAYLVAVGWHLVAMERSALSWNIILTMAK